MPGTLENINVINRPREDQRRCLRLRRLLGVKTADGKQAKVAKLTKNEILMVNIGSAPVQAIVMGVKADAAKLTLTTPVCTKIGEKIALSRKIDKHWRLIGWANIVA